MDERDITTPEQLEAALAEQRARRTQRLQKQAHLSYFWLLLLPLAAATLLAAIFLRDRQLAIVSCATTLLLSAATGYQQIRQQREQALKALEKEGARR